MDITPAGAPRPGPSFVLTDLNGIETRLADLKGKLFLLNFWATRCEPCRPTAFDPTAMILDTPPTDGKLPAELAPPVRLAQVDSR